MLAVLLMAVTTLLLIGDIGCAEPLDCADVRIKAIHPLQFGHLLAKPGEKGWFLLDTDKDYFMSPSVSTRKDSFPSPGQVQVTAPSGSRLDLKINAQQDSDQDGDPENRIRLINLKVSSRALTVTRAGKDHYQVVVPETKDGTEVSFMLDIGGELSLKTVASPLATRAVIYIECFAITSLN